MRTSVVALAAATQLCGPGDAIGPEGDASRHRQPAVRIAQAETTRDTEANLRNIIGQLEQAAPDYAGLEPPLQRAIRPQLQATAAF